MSIGIVADKYSSAILELAEEQNNLQEMEQDLSYVSNVMKEHPELNSFLMNPIMTAQSKIELMGKIFEQSINKTALHLLYVMIQRGRYRFIEESIRGFISKSRHVRGILEATVTVTEPLSESMEQALTAKLKELTGKDIMLDVKQDSSIMGGLVVQIGDQRIDGSVARRLSELEKTLLKIDAIG